jgi:hypothetical protein
MCLITEFIRHINPKEQASEHYNVNMGWFRKSRRKECEPPYYLINLDEVCPQRSSSGNIAKGVGVLLTFLTIIATVSTLYERTNRTSLNLSLQQTIRGYFLRVVNSGSATAISVKVDLESWPVGAPGSWRWSFPPRDLPPGSDSIILMELVPSSLPESDQRGMLDALSNSVLSGYVMVTCNNCNESKNWAFSFPGYKTGEGKFFARSLPPFVAVPRLEDRPHIGYCVDFPKGVCGSFSSVWMPKEGR